MKVRKKIGKPGTDRAVLVAYQDGDRVGFDVARYWRRENLWYDTDGFVLCEGDDILGWFELTPFEEAMKQKNPPV